MKEQIRKHELYRVLLSTSKLYEDEVDNMYKNINNEDLLHRSQERAQLISDVLAEVCGLSREREGKNINRN